MQRHTPTATEGRQALRDHLIDKASAARDRHGDPLDPESFRRMLSDPSVVRYPVKLRFEAGSLLDGEFAFPEEIGEHPSEGFILWMHPKFESRPEAWPLLAAYYIPVVNYGDIVEADDCEAFAAHLFGIEQDDYYERICAFADLLG